MLYSLISGNTEIHSLLLNVSEKQYLLVLKKKIIKILSNSQ